MSPSTLGSLGPGEALLEQTGSILSANAVQVHMGQAALQPAVPKDTFSARRRFDKKILILFAVLATFSIGISASLYLFTEGTTIYELASSVLGLLTFSFLVVGIPVYIRYRKSGLTP